MPERSARRAGAIMRAEIHEQPGVLARLVEDAALRRVGRALARRRPALIVLAARGSSDHAALYGRYLIEAMLGIPVSLAAPSLVTLYGARLRLARTVTIGLSQSGASPDIVEVVQAAREAGSHTIAITNVPASLLAHAADETLLLGAGPERSLPATKTYIAQLAALSLLVAEAAGDGALRAAHRALPDHVARALATEDAVRELALRYRYVEECLITARGYNYATAREAALKLKETCRVVAEPLSSADLLHGPIAVVERGFPLVVIAPPGRALAHLHDVAARLGCAGAETAVLSSDRGILATATVPIAVPVEVDERLSPHAYIAPLQLLAYHLARARGLDPDRPRGLRKITRVR